MKSGKEDAWVRSSQVDKVGWCKDSETLRFVCMSLVFASDLLLSLVAPLLSFTR